MTTAADIHRAERTLNFFHRLFPKLAPEEQIEIRTIPSGKDASAHPNCIFAGAQDEAMHAALHAPANHNVYFGVCPRTNNGSTAQFVTRVNALWADLDFKTGHDLQSRHQQVMALPTPPSFTVHTGGGLHCYWLLAEPIPAHKSGPALALMRRIAAHLQADNVADLPRVMRVPFTLNHKYDPPKLAKIVGWHPDRIYTLAQLSDHFSTAPTIPSASTNPQSLTPSPSLDTALALSGVPEGQRDITIFRLACKLRRANVPLEMASRLVAEAARNCTPPFPEKEALAKVVRAYQRYPQGPDEIEVIKEEREQHRIGLIPEADATALASETSPDADLSSLPLLGLPGYIIEGWSHLVAGYPRAGKTELLTRLCLDWLKLGKKVLYITEEPRSIWQRRLRTLSSAPDTSASAPDPATLHSSVLSVTSVSSVIPSSQPDMPPDPFDGLTIVFALASPPEVIFQRAFARDEQIVIIDTLRNLINLGDETDNSRIAATLNPWVATARQFNKTIIVAHHMRKGSGQHGEGIAGGHAMLGVFDVALEVMRSDKSTTRRHIRAYARIITPPEIVYELEPDGNMRYLGEPEALRLEDVVERLDLVLSDEWLLTRELRDALGDPAPSPEQLRVALTRLAQSGQVERDPPLNSGQAQGLHVRWRRARSQESQVGPPAA
jgi:hypothetical protein